MREPSVQPTLFDEAFRVPVPEPEPVVVRTPMRRGDAKRYEAMARAMLKKHQIKVRKWRSSTSGVAWQLTARDGSVTRMIESPRPRGPMSAAVFIHEVGHHAIGFDTYKPRCLEEYHAWMYALGQMVLWDIPVTERVSHRVHDSLHYAIEKAVRRGLRALPGELVPYIHRRTPDKSP